MTYFPDSGQQPAAASWPPAPAGEAQFRVRKPFLSQIASEPAFQVLVVLNALCLVADCVTAIDARLLPTSIDGVYRLVSGILFLVLGIRYLRWVHAITRNLEAFDTRGAYISPGWAVGYYFIPILSWFKPYNAMTEVWKASDSDVDSSNPVAWPSVKTPGLLLSWWLLWMCWNVVGPAFIIGGIIVAGGNAGNWFTRIAVLFNTVIGLIAIYQMWRVIQTVNRRQDAKEASLAASL